MSNQENKLVAVLNKSIEAGRLMNALGHMSVGLGAQLGKEELLISDYKDADQGSHPNISAMPFIVLRANSNKIRALRQAAIEHNIAYADFIDTMTTGGHEAQIAKTAETKEADLNYIGIVLCGNYELLSQLTKKFSLWK